MLVVAVAHLDTAAAAAAAVVAVTWCVCAVLSDMQHRHGKALGHEH